MKKRIFSMLFLYRIMYSVLISKCNEPLVRFVPRPRYTDSKLQTRADVYFKEVSSQIERTWWMRNGLVV